MTTGRIESLAIARCRWISCHVATEVGRVVSIDAALDVARIQVRCPPLLDVTILGEEDIPAAYLFPSRKRCRCGRLGGSMPAPGLPVT